MGIPEKIAKVRFSYHASLTSVGNILNQLGVLSDNKANAFNEKHLYKALGCLPFMSENDIKKLDKK